jgi:hypothetical protein
LYLEPDFPQYVVRVSRRRNPRAQISIAHQAATKKTKNVFLCALLIFVFPRGLAEGVTRVFRFQLHTKPQQKNKKCIFMCGVDFCISARVTPLRS